MDNFRYADVYVGYPIQGSFTYSIPEGISVQPGMRIRADFAKRIVNAFVFRVHNNKPDLKEIKEIIKAIDPFPVFDNRLISLAEYTAYSYISFTGEVLAAALPSGEKASERFKNPFKGRKAELRNIVLNQEQRTVYDNIVSDFNKEKLYHLIFGITGSGKTEVYIELAKYVLSRGRSVIYLVPEITLSSQIFERLYNVFGDGLLVYHSRIAANQRLSNWIKFFKGEAKIVIGTRSAVFMQCPDLGLIILDEEHDLSYKEHGSPRYHARRLAYFRCSMEKSLMVMGSATPSIESLHSAETGIFRLHRLECRHENAALPAISIIRLDPRKETIISPPLMVQTKRALDTKNQAIFLLNRRGFSPVMMCGRCRKISECPNCSISLNLHKVSPDGDRLICHFCGYSRMLPDECPDCGSEEFVKLGAGTQKAEDAISGFFPDAKIYRMDHDSTRRKNTVFEIVEKMTNGNIDILVGTQMVAKGFDFRNVSVVGVLLADVGLNMPDFRASERIFSLLIQAAGRCGRGEKPGNVVIQTLDEENYLYSFLKKHDYLGFYRHELSLRKTLAYPPFSRIARLLVRGKNDDKVIRAVNDLKSNIEKEIKNAGYRITVLGPAAAPFSKISGSYRHHVILKSRNVDAIRKVIRSAGKISGTGLHLEIDVDPYDVL